MYTFAETEYQWCPQCGGNIRQNAKYCRFCRKPIENRLLKQTVMPPFVTIQYLGEWLLPYSDLKLKCSAEFLQRLEQAEAAAPPKISGLLEAHLPPREERCLPHPPEAGVAGLLWDILLSLYDQGESLTEICDSRHMRLLEITPQEVAAENELRKEEMQKGNQCRYCHEYIFPNDEVCRFCEGSENKVPVHVDHFFDKPIDAQLLRQVILYEAAWRRLNDGDPVPQEILDMNTCSQEEIEQEVMRQETGQYEQPIPRFTKRMVEVNLKTTWTPEQLCVMAFSALARSLDNPKEERSAEALIVLDHALRRTEGKDELMHERGSILTDLALLYLRKKDDAKYKLYDSMANECKKFGMSDAVIAVMDKTNQIMKSMFKNKEMLDKDPEKRLAAFDKDLETKTDNLVENIIGKIEHTIPGMSELMSKLTGGLNETKITTRLMLEAQVAQKNGDLEKAISKYSEALSRTDEDCITGGNTKVSILCSLAEIRHQQGDDSAAESLSKEALESAKEYAEAKPALGEGAYVCALSSYATFLSDVGRYEESETHFQQALAMQEESTSKSMKKYGGERADYSGQLAGIKEKYAKLLRKSKRDEEAEKFEAEAKVHKQEAEDRAAELKARRERLNPGQ